MRLLRLGALLQQGAEGIRLPAVRGAAQANVLDEGSGGTAGDAYLAQRVRRTDVDGGLPLFEDGTIWQHDLFRSVFPPQTGERLHWTLGRVLGDALGDALEDVHRGSREGPAAASRAGLLARWGVLTRYVLQLGRETAHFLGAQ